MQVRVVPQDTFQGYAFSEADDDDITESDEECDDEEALHYDIHECEVFLLKSFYSKFYF